MADAATVRVAAPAKLNLYLHVTGRRADGFHLLDSLVAFADVGDAVEVRAAPDIGLAVSGPFAADVPGGNDNLVLRAAHALASGQGAAIALTKNLPVASGIGGGSSDAAATLLALARLWGLRPAASEFDRLALALGADVPACLRARPLWLAGVGEVLEDGPDLPPAHLVLVNPGLPLATPEVFRAFADSGAPHAPAARADVPLENVHVLAAFLRERRNDLELVARFMAPPVDAALAALGVQPGCLLARMSGSGATCFGLFMSRLAAERAVRQIAAAEPGWWVTAANWHRA